MSAQAPADDLATLWRRVRGELETSLPASTFELWLEPVRAVSAHGSTLFLTAPPSARAWVERRYAATIATTLRAQQTGLTEIGFVDADADAGARTTQTDAAVPASLPLDSAHTFDRFVIGTPNRLAHAAALAVAELPGEAYNPLFLHGPPGLGKTHLLGAIDEYLRRNHPELNVHSTTAERFTSEFVTSLRRDGPEAFKARYRDLDALLIDDVQVLEGKPATEEEFVHTFNTLHAAGKQIVLSSDRPPEALSQLAERLRDRFRWGLQVELEQPDLPTRIALLWRMASDSGPELPEPGVLHEIATRVPENVRVLEGAMTRVLAVASVLSEPLSAPVVRRALGHEHSAPIPSAARTPTLEAIQDAVCQIKGLSREELVSAGRSAKVARARQVAMYLARELTPLSLTQIARGFDRDHTTVLHAVRSISSKLEPGSETAQIIHRAHVALGTSKRGAGYELTDETSAPHDPPG